MRSKKEIEEYLAEIKGYLAEDDLQDFDNKLPCCDYARLEEAYNILTWVLDSRRVK